MMGGIIREAYRRAAELIRTVISGEVRTALGRQRMASRLEQGESIKISGFGTFSVRQKGRRIGRNPKTGQEVPISPRRVLVFRASHALKDQINHGLAEPIGNKRKRGAA